MDNRIANDMISSGMIPSGEKKKEDLSRIQYGSAPSPSKLMDAYKSMYKEESDVPKMTDSQRRYFAKRDQADDDMIRARQQDKIETAKNSPQAQKIKSDKIKKARETFRTGQRQENIDLLAAYRAVHEHHQKDKDGNTIPHEGEELNEALPLVPALGKVAMIAAKKGVAGMAAKGAGKAGLKATAMAFKNPTAGNIGKVAGQALKGAAKDPLVQQQVVGGMINKMSEPKEKLNKSGMVTAGADLFDIIKGQLLDEGLSEEEIRDIMLTLTPDEILKEIEESSMSAGSGGGTGRDAYSDGGDGVHRSFQQVGNMFNKNIPTKKQTGGKVDKMTRKAINTSARDFGIQGPTTLKQSVEPEGETI